MRWGETSRDVICRDRLSPLGSQKSSARSRLANAWVGKAVTQDLDLKLEHKAEWAKMKPGAAGAKVGAASG